MEHSKAPRIVLISPDAPGPHAVTSAGHVALRLAQRLVAEGAAVDLLVPRDGEAGLPLTHWYEHYRALGIALHVLPWGDGADNMLGFRALEWLRARPAPDAVLALDHRALGACALLARQIGLTLQGVPIGVVLTGPDGWAEPAGQATSPTRTLRRHLERQAIQGADFWLPATAGLAGWCAAQGFSHHPCRLLEGLGQAILQPGAAAELRLAEGLRDAAQARALAALLAQPVPPLRMPPPPNIEGVHADPLAVFITALDGARPDFGLDFEVRGVAQPTPFGAATILLLPGPASATAPLAIDAAAAGLPMLALEDAGRWPAAVPGPAPLPARLPAPLPAPLWAPLLPFLAAQQAPPPPAALTGPPPLVSVCISHFDRPKLLAQTLDSLRRQTWPAVEVVLVDDASPSAATREFLAAQEADFAARGWQIIRNETEQWQSISRNKAARAARGAFILVMDDDNLARPHEIETMIRALHATGADAAGALQALFEGDHDALEDDTPDRVEFFPTGGPADVGVVWNVFGDVNVMFRREAFEALGGYTEERELGCEDYEIGAALARAGRRLIIIPEALYLYRFSSVNMARGMSNERLYRSHQRPLRPALQGVDPATARLLAFTHGAEHALQQNNGWSYWAGRPFAVAQPKLGIHDPNATGADFLYQVTMAALAAGDAGPAMRMLPALARQYRTDRRLVRGLFEAALLRPADAALRREVMAADRRAGTQHAQAVARLLLRRGDFASARAWIEAGLPELFDLLPDLPRDPAPASDMPGATA